jgi:hypothetical protein
MSDMGEFEEQLARCNWDGKGALIDVADTLYLCAAWWRQFGRGITPSAADLLRMTELVLAREEENRRRETAWQSSSIRPEDC